MAVYWPTHASKARAVKNAALARKKRNRRQRKLLKGGKREPLDA